MSRIKEFIDNIFYTWDDILLLNTYDIGTRKYWSTYIRTKESPITNYTLWQLEELLCNLDTNGFRKGFHISEPEPNYKERTKSYCYTKLRTDETCKTVHDIFQLCVESEADTRKQALIKILCDKDIKHCLYTSIRCILRELI